MNLSHVQVDFTVGVNGVIRIEALPEGLVVTGASGRRAVIPSSFGEKPPGGHAPVKKAAPAPAKKKPAPKAAAPKPAPKRA